VTLFWVWMGLLVLGFTIYFGVLRLRHRDYAPFRIRLTGFFLLFVLIPTIPSAFIIAQLMTQSADILLMPGMDSALSTGLDAVRQQSEDRGRRFLQSHNAPAQWTETLRQTQDMTLLLHCRLTGDSVAVMHRLAAEGPAATWRPMPEQLLAARSGRHSQILRTPDQGRIAVFHCLNDSDSTQTVAVYNLDDEIIAAKDRLTHALRAYATLSLIKESMIEQGVIWALAVLVVFALAFLAAAASNRLSRHISRPVQDLVSAMTRVAGGDLSTPVTTPAKDEFRLLVNAFNQMMIDLAESRRRLVEAEKLAAWQSVARQISHEIKNSLTPISISLRRLRGHFGSTALPARVSESLNAVEDELHSMEHMAGTFSQFARLPAPQMAPVEINTLVRQAAELIRPTLEGRQLVMHLDNALPPVEADREQMKRVLNNLLKNAIEATASGDCITLLTATHTEGDRTVRLEVSDTGQGMDEETRQHLFEPHFSTKQRGSGLGLAMVHRIVQGHHGRLEVESQIGLGTRFTLHL